MGKKNKIKTRIDNGPQQSLGDQIMDGRIVKQKARNKVRLRAEEEERINPKLSEKILKQAQKQRAEIALESFGPTPGEAKAAGHYDLKQSKDDNFSDDEVDFDGDEDYDGGDINDRMQLTEEDERAMKMFENVNGVKGKTLGDLIMEKIEEKKQQVNEAFSEAGPAEDDIHPEIREMYEGVRDILKNYRSGRVPKPFKVLPQALQWERYLYITEPEQWTAAAMFQATRIFTSSLTEKMAQRFYNLVLLPRIRDDLAEYQRLNTYLYRSLQKALFKSNAFFKGIIIPLLEAGDCTLREALIFGSVIANNRIPLLESAACLLKICEMEYSGANSIFLRLFFEKRYALPYRVVDAAVFHFLRFEQDKRELPTIWHFSFLTFVQRYKNDISSEQREALLHLLKKKSHYKITPEIRRELMAARCRDVECSIPLTEDDDAAATSSMDFE